MSETLEIATIDSSNSTLYEILKNCANFRSHESLPVEDYNDVCAPTNCSDMISTNMYSISSNVSTSSFASDDSLVENILEEDGRISLAYENLRTIPRRIAEKFAMQTKFLDLSYNDFQNLSFLSLFEDLHTLILDRNSHMDVNSLPFLPNLKILWINNCDITNICDWIQRIRTQCPALEHLSIMGNPGIKNPINCSTFPLYFTSEPASLDYRLYVFQALPRLQYLDGNPRSTLVSTIKDQDRALIPSSPTTSLEHSSSSHGQSAVHKISPTLSLRDIFRLKRRKKSYPSSSTN